MTRRWVWHGWRTYLPAWIFLIGLASWWPAAASRGSQSRLVIVVALAAPIVLARIHPTAGPVLSFFGLAGLTQYLLFHETVVGSPGVGYLICLVAVSVAAWQAMTAIGQRHSDYGLQALLVPALFGAWLLVTWQLAVAGFGIPQILLPAPTQIGYQLVTQSGMLWSDFQQTFLKSTLAGFVLGCGLGFAVAVLTDRVPFLQRGLLPLGNLVSAVPIIGVAPIMVMWFGFGWESKAAVIVVMTFFPMLINTIAGLSAADHMSRDLMRSYGSSYWQTFLKLRLPAALPFIFNALKINSTLALIGAIVAEFFGSPISGMGFRISTEVYKMNVDIVWATIAVAALAGSLFYGLLALIERRLTFWHPSYRSRSRVR
jgi:NitT/TauT family transport system permease protein